MEGEQLRPTTELLRTVPLLGDLNEPELQQIVAFFTIITLRAGQTLSIWKTEANQGLSRSDQQLIRRIGYSVRSGDSLYTIADRFRVSINDIKRWNKLEKSKYLQPGKRLTLYVDITKAR